MFAPPKRIVTFNHRLEVDNCDVTYRSRNTLRFPRARDEPPHTQRTLVVGLIVFAFPQDKESFFEIHRTQKKRFSFSRSLRVFPSLSTALIARFHYYDGCLERRTVD